MKKIRTYPIGLLGEKSQLANWRFKVLFCFCFCFERRERVINDVIFADFPSFLQSCRKTRCATFTKKKRKK